MNSLYSIKIPVVPKTIWFLGVYLLIGIYVFGIAYHSFDSTNWMALVLAPYVFIFQKAEKSGKYFIFSMACLLLSVFIHLNSIYFLAVAFGLFFMLESFVGKINRLPFLWIVVISPVFKHFGIVFGFPLRLKLTEIVGRLLGIIGYKAEILGNIIRLNGTEFSVDPACTGLQMMAISCLAGLLIMAFFERQQQISFSFLSSGLIFSGIMLLNIFCNLVRIVVLVIFHILPENPLHDILGLVCLGVYVIIPAYFLIQFAAVHFPFRLTPALIWMLACVYRLFPFVFIRFLFPSRPVNTLSAIKLTGINFFLVILIVIQGFLFRMYEPVGQLVNCNLTDCQKEVLKNGIIKLENEKCLIYIKPLAGFYSAEHTPLICWQGSGYRFSHTATRTIAGTEMYCGVLTKEKDTLYTAWWFDNGNFRTIHPLEWRMRAIKGEKDFSLVNVNATTETQLTEAVSYILKEKIFKN
jgi:exosortase/archaeosortase family protein